MSSLASSYVSLLFIFVGGCAFAGHTPTRSSVNSPRLMSPGQSAVGGSIGADTQDPNGSHLIAGGRFRHGLGTGLELDVEIDGSFRFHNKSTTTDSGEKVPAPGDDLSAYRLRGRTALRFPLVENQLALDLGLGASFSWVGTLATADIGFTYSTPHRVGPIVGLRVFGGIPVSNSGRGRYNSIYPFHSERDLRIAQHIYGGMHFSGGGRFELDDATTLIASLGFGFVRGRYEHPDGSTDTDHVFPLHIGVEIQTKL